MVLKPAVPTLMTFPSPKLASFRHTAYVRHIVVIFCLYYFITMFSHRNFNIPGKTWQIAELKKSEQPEGKAWGWTLWEATIPVEDRDTVEICCKAIDSAYNCQPESVGPIWNLRGVLSTAWHSVKVTVLPDEE